MSVRATSAATRDFRRIEFDACDPVLGQAGEILIVDDDALARDGIRELVESLGYKATTFELLQHFLESSMLAETTCLITDVQMRGLSGLELQEALQSSFVGGGTQKAQKAGCP